MVSREDGHRPLEVTTSPAGFDLLRFQLHLPNELQDGVFEFSRVRRRRDFAEGPSGVAREDVALFEAHFPPSLHLALVAEQHDGEVSLPVDEQLVVEALGLLEARPIRDRVNVEDGVSVGQVVFQRTLKIHKQNNELIRSTSTGGGCGGGGGGGGAAAQFVASSLTKRITIKIEVVQMIIHSYTSLLRRWALSELTQFAMSCRTSLARKNFDYAT